MLATAVTVLSKKLRPLLLLLLLLLTGGTTNTSYQGCFVVNTAPHCTYNQKVMRRLFLLCSRIHSLSEKRRKTAKQSRLRARKGTGRFAAWSFCTALLFSPIVLHQGQTHGTGAIRGSMRAALDRIPLQYHGRPRVSGGGGRCTVTGRAWAEIRKLIENEWQDAALRSLSGNDPVNQYVAEKHLNVVLLAWFYKINIITI